MKNIKLNSETLTLVLFFTMLLIMYVWSIQPNSSTNINQNEIFDQTNITLMYDLDIIDIYEPCPCVEYDQTTATLSIKGNTFTLPTKLLFVSQTNSTTEILAITGSYKDVYTIAVAIQQGKDFNNLTNNVKLNIALSKNCIMDIYNNINKKENIPQGKNIKY